MTAGEQLPFAFPPRAPALGRGDFLASSCNAAALGWIERWPDWGTAAGFPALVLHGPSGCGKSHLAHLWQARSGGRLIGGDALAGADPATLAASGAIAVDDAERAPEETLLHLYNCIREAGAGLLVIGHLPPAGWPIALPDLASRLRALPAVAIGPPDDTVLAAVLVKHFADRQVQVAPAVIAFLVRRMERSFAAAAGLAARLDRLSLGAGRRIDLTVARRALAEAAEPAR